MLLVVSITSSDLKNTLVLGLDVNGVGWSGMDIDPSPVYHRRPPPRGACEKEGHKCDILGYGRKKGSQRQESSRGSGEKKKKNYLFLLRVTSREPARTSS